MRKILVLDLSTSTGYSVQEHSEDGVKLVEQGTLVNELKVDDFGPYPFSYIHAARNIARLCAEKVMEFQPTAIVIEETNGSRSRYTQKILEYIHFAVLERLESVPADIVYINTSDWRKAVGGHLSKEDKKRNAKVAQLKRKARKDGKLDTKLFAKLKKEAGIRGKVNKKHVAIRVANEMFGLELKAKDDDIADAICIGLALHLGVPRCDGKDNQRKRKKANEQGVE